MLQIDTKNGIAFYIKRNIRANIVANLPVYRKLYKEGIRHYLYNNKYIVLFKLATCLEEGIATELRLYYQIIKLERYVKGKTYDDKEHLALWKVRDNKVTEFIGGR